jgi:hypothetical protein
LESLKTHPTIGVCGLDCGLCPRYYTAGTSRCPGCGGPGFSQKHPSCSFITCCIKKRSLEVCGQCPDWPCSKFKGEEEYRKLESSSSYPPYRKVLSNLRFIKDEGVDQFIELQKTRIGLLETMIKGYDEGRSKSFYCRAAALLDPKTLKGSLDKAEELTKACGSSRSDMSQRAKVLRAVLAEATLCEAIQLTGKQ